MDHCSGREKSIQSKRPVSLFSLAFARKITLPFIEIFERQRRKLIVVVDYKLVGADWIRRMSSWKKRKKKIRVMTV